MSWWRVQRSKIALKGSDEGRMLDAIDSLGELGDRRAINALQAVMISSTRMVERASLGWLLGVADIHTLIAIRTSLSGAEQLAVAPRNDERMHLCQEIDLLSTLRYCRRQLADNANEPAHVRVRRRAIFLLGKIAHPRAVELLDSEIDTATEDERSYLIDALGDIGTETAMHALRMRLMEKKDVILSGDWAPSAELTKLRSNGWQPTSTEERLVVGVLEENWDDVASLGNQGFQQLSKIAFSRFAPSPVRSRGAFAAMSTLEHPDVLPTLAKAIDNQDEYIRSGAVAALIDARKAGTYEALEPLIRERRSGHAVRVLGALGDQRGVTLLLSLFRQFSAANTTQDSGADVGFVLEVFTALGRMVGSINNASTFLDNVSSHLNRNEVRDGLLRILNRAADLPDAVPREPTQYSHWRYLFMTAAAAVDGLAYIKEEQVVIALLDALRFRGTALHSHLALALGEQGDQRAIEPIIALYDSSEALGTYRQNIVAALAKIPSPLTDAFLARVISEHEHGRGGHNRHAVLAAAKTGRVADDAGPVIEAKQSSRVIPKTADKSNLTRRLFPRWLSTTFAEEFVELLRDKSNHIGLAQLGSGLAVAPLLRHLFMAPRGQYVDDDGEQALYLLAPHSRLRERWAHWAVRAAGYRLKSRYQGDDKPTISHELGDVAILSLCLERSPVTSNILHFVAQKKDVMGCEFRNQREMALIELKKRKQPRYDSAHFLTAWELLNNPHRQGLLSTQVLLESSG